MRETVLHNRALGDFARDPDELDPLEVVQLRDGGGRAKQLIVEGQARSLLEKGSQLLRSLVARCRVRASVPEDGFTRMHFTTAELCELCIDKNCENRRVASRVTCTADVTESALPLCCSVTAPDVSPES